MLELIEDLKDKEIIHIICSNVVDESDFSSSRNLVLKLHSEYGFKKVLVEVEQLNNRINTFQAFNHGSIVAENYVLNRLKYAVVSTKHCLNDFGFIVTVATNRGVKAKLFETKDMALRWLDGGQV